MKLASLLAATIFLVSPDKLTAQQKRASFFTWRKFGVLPSAEVDQPSHGVGGAIAGIHANRLIILGGTYFPEKMPWAGGKKKYETKGFVYTIDDNGAVSLEHEFEFPVPIGYAAVSETSEGLLIAGGENQEGLSKKTWILNYNASDKFVTFHPLPDLPFAISSASACFVSGKLFLAGGETELEASNKLLQLDLKLPNSEWKILANIPHAVSHAVLFAVKNSSKNLLILAGGRRKSPGQLTTFYDQVYQYNLNSNSWKEAPSLPYPLAAGTGLAIEEGTCFIFGGDKGETYHRVEELVFLINKSSDKGQIDSLNELKAKVQSNHPGFSKEILMLDGFTKKWIRAGKIPFETPVTTRAFFWGDRVVLAPGEIKAGVRTADIYSAIIHKPLP